MNLIHTTPGNVSLFNIMYDIDKQVYLIIDEELLTATSLAFHPLYNGMSIFLSPEGCLKFLEIIHRNMMTIAVPEKETKKFTKTYNNC